MWKNKKFTLTEKIFREINSLVTCLVKPLLSRNFCQKSVRENFPNFHSVVCVLLDSNILCESNDDKHAKMTISKGQRVKEV